VSGHLNVKGKECEVPKQDGARDLLSGNDQRTHVPSGKGKLGGKCKGGESTSGKGQESNGNGIPPFIYQSKGKQFKQR